MLDEIAAAILPLVWFAHASLIVLIAYQCKGKPYELKIATVIYLFYSVAPLLPFELEFFKADIVYTPSSPPLILYIVTDVIFLVSVTILYRDTSSGPAEGSSYPDLLRSGYACLVIVAILAMTINVYSNFQEILLPKNEFIASLNGNVVPNLLYFQIPAEELLAGALIFNPFKRMGLRYLVLGMGLMTVGLSIFQGYRHIVLILLLWFIFRYRPQTSVMAVVAALTLAGEISNPIKYLIGGLMTNPDFSVSDYIAFQMTNQNNFKLASSEQLAAFSNLMIGIRDLSSNAALYELFSGVPFSSRLMTFSQTGAERIGEVVGVGPGQGSGYNYQLFLLESSFVGAFVMFPVMLLIRIFSGTMLSVYSLIILFSLMRNTPAFWASQFKMLIVLYLFVVFSSLVYSYGLGEPRRNIN